MKLKYTLLILSFLCTCFVSKAQKGPEPKYIETKELIFPEQSEHVHGSSLVLLPNGDLLAAWFQGSGERKADDVRIMGARLKQGSWTKPFLMADTKGLPDCNPVLFLNKANKLFLVWIAVQANRWENSILKFRTSTDYDSGGSPDWDWQDNILLKPDDAFAEEVASKFKDLPENHAGWAEYAPLYDDMIIEASKDQLKRSIGWMTRIKPLILESGRIILPLYSDGLNMSITAISDDDGESWRAGLPMVGRGPIQPALAQRENGDIIALMRDSGDPPARVHRSISTDRGESWSASEKTDIPNTASVELLKLQDGTWAFLGNDITDGRYRLSLYLSDDEGETWSRKVRIEDVPRGAGSFSYPSLIEDQKGNLHMTYSHRTGAHNKSIKYVVVNPSKI
ncbi:MAG: exo-alpha-sialidase [Cytophagales bacterium]|nr:exo-alpha-sialidase [Cytophagales bacterium]